MSRINRQGIIREDSTNSFHSKVNSQQVIDQLVLPRRGFGQELSNYPSSNQQQQQSHKAISGSSNSQPNSKSSKNPPPHPPAAETLVIDKEHLLNRKAHKGQQTQQQSYSQFSKNPQPYLWNNYNDDGSSNNNNTRDYHPAQNMFQSLQQSNSFAGLSSQLNNAKSRLILVERKPIVSSQVSQSINVSSLSSAGGGAAVQIASSRPGTANSKIPVKAAQEQSILLDCMLDDVDDDNENDGGQRALKIQRKVLLAKRAAISSEADDSSEGAVIKSSNGNNNKKIIFQHNEAAATATVAAPSSLAVRGFDAANCTAASNNSREDIRLNKSIHSQPSNALPSNESSMASSSQMSFQAINMMNTSNNSQHMQSQNSFLGNKSQSQQQQQQLPKRHYCFEEIERKYLEIEKEDSSKPTNVAQYQREIFAGLKLKEKAMVINKNYMEEQPDISEQMRLILVDWLVSVHRRFKLLQETLFLCVYIVDKYLSMNRVSREKLQLVGVCALFIAAKYEEIYPPELSEFANTTARAYSTQDILTMEGQIITALNFQITVPSPFRFLQWYARLANLSKKDQYFAQYFVELSLLHTRFLSYSASNIAAAAVYLANRLGGITNEYWSDILEFDSGYTETQLRACSKDLILLQQSQPTARQRSVWQKYCQSAYLQVGTISLAVPEKKNKQKTQAN